MASDTDVQLDEDGNWQADFYDAEHRQRLRGLLAERDPQRRKRIFDAIEWDAVCEDLMVVIDGLTDRVAYDRPRLVDVLIYHQATATSGCICGWGVLGASHAEHVVDVYEAVTLLAGAGGGRD
jgi:hypothetical protein